MLYSIDNNYIAVFDNETAGWSSVSPGTEALTNYWHHNRYVSPGGKLITFGGYGYHMYKNEILEWDPVSEKFEQVSYQGEFHPRYLAGMGVNPADSMIYLVGGYGSESGKQTESPDYYYEILRYSPQDLIFTRVFEFNDVEAGFCFSNSLIFDDEKNLYGLYYSKYEFDNMLQLVKIPLDKPRIIELGDPIEYRFIDVNSYTDLYYSTSLKALIVLSSFTSDGETSITAYTIAFPPQAFDTDHASGEKGSRSRWLYLLIVLMVMAILYLIYSRLRKRSLSQHKPKEVPLLSAEKQKENAILLFGGFQVFNNEGKDITGQFTPLPKKLFLYIMLNSLRNEKGVSSKALYETFWFDKPMQSARNNRAVNIVKLKGLLENLTATSITKKTGYWKFDFDPTKIYIDYYDYLQIMRRKTPLTRENVVSLLSIVENRPFLINTDAEWLDSFKAEVSNEIMDTFLKYIGSSKDDPEFLLHLTNCIFMFDAVSEEALKLKCRLLIKQGKHSLANNTYIKFINEYRQLYGEEYGLSYNQVIGDLA
jgi:two-component SAPR family response regulator